MKLWKIFVVLLFLFVSVPEIIFVSANAASDNERTEEEEKQERNRRNAVQICSARGTSQEECKTLSEYNAPDYEKEQEINNAIQSCENNGMAKEYCNLITDNIDSALENSGNLARKALEATGISAFKGEKPVPFDCDCNQLLFPKYRDTNYNYKALNHLFKCVGKYIRHWQAYSFEPYLDVLNELKGTAAEELYRNLYPYETTVAELAEGKDEPWRYNFFLPEIKEKFVKNIIASREELSEKEIDRIIAEDNEQYREYIKEFVENETLYDANDRDGKGGYEKYCHVINRSQWDLESKPEIKVPNPKHYLPYERVYNPEQSPWFPRNTKVATINTSMGGLHFVPFFDGAKMPPLGVAIQYLSTRVGMNNRSCDPDKGCSPCDFPIDLPTCTATSLWHSKYGRCGDQPPKCNGFIRESVDILESRVGEYKQCLDSFTAFHCLQENCLHLPVSFVVEMAMYTAGRNGILALETIWPEGNGYCCSIIDKPVTPNDAMGLHYNMLEVRDYRNAWRNKAPSTRPNLEEISIGAPRSIYKRNKIAHEHLDGKDIQEYNYWWPWWARASGVPITDNCTVHPMGGKLVVMSVVQPYWTWPDIGTTNPHDDPFHDSISPGVAGANCGYGGWAETKLYQARCMKYFQMDCLCRYEQTFKTGSSEAYVLHKLGGLYYYMDEENQKQSFAWWPFPWQGYVSNPITEPKEKAENPRGFPMGYSKGHFELVDGGLDNAQTGDIIVWDHSRGKHPLGNSSAGYNSSYQMMPHTAYISKTYNKRHKEAFKVKSDKSQDYIEVSEYNYGKVPDSCGNTTNWKIETTRTIYPYQTMNKELQKFGDKESVTCLDPDNDKCEDPFWEVGVRSPKVYRLVPKEPSNSDKCDYAGLDSHYVLYDTYTEASKKHSEAIKNNPKGGKIEDYLGEYYELKEKIEENIANGCYPPPSWRQDILKYNPDITSKDATTGLLFSRQIHAESLLGASSPLKPVLTATSTTTTVGYTKAKGKSTSLAKGLPAKLGKLSGGVGIGGSGTGSGTGNGSGSGSGIGSGNTGINPTTTTNPKSGCYYATNIDAKGNPELILDSIWDSSETASDEIFTAYTYLNSLADIIENERSGAETKLIKLVNKLKHQNDSHTETMMALMSYQYYDKCCPESSDAIDSKDLALERRNTFKDSIKEVENMISSGEDVEKILPELTVALTEYFYFEAYFMDVSRNILKNLSGCSGSDFSESESYNVELSTNIETILNSLDAIDGVTIDTYRNLADILYIDYIGALKLTRETMNLLSNISDEISTNVWIKSRQCSPDTEVCNINAQPVYNPLIIGKSSENCASLGDLSEQEHLDLICEDAPRTCSEAADCWREPTEATCDMYGELNLKISIDNPFEEYPLSHAKHRDEGYSRDFIAAYLYSYSDFSEADKNEYIMPLLNNFPIEWCDLEFVQDRVIESTDEIESGVTIAVITTDRYELGHVSLVYEYDEENECAYLYGQNWLTHQCQAFSDENCHQSYSSFNKPSLSPNCIPIKDISYMWNAVCDESTPCE